MEAFGGLPGIHKGLVNGLLSDRNSMINMSSLTEAERAKAEEDASKAFNVALLTSGVDKHCYRQLKNQLAHNYLLGTDHHLNTYCKALCILGNYQVAVSNKPYIVSRNENGLAFIQKGGQGQGRGGRGGGAGRSVSRTMGANVGGGRRGDASTITGGSGEQQAQS